MPRSCFPYAPFLVALALLAGCSSSSSGGTSAEDAGCVKSPGLGAACTPGVSVACSPGSNSCCPDLVATCDPTTKTWEGADCRCELEDAAVPVDAGHATDSATSDASNPCGGCAAGKICVATASAAPGGPETMTNACEPIPAACDGGVSGECASSLCTCGGGTLMGTTYECSCLEP